MMQGDARFLAIILAVASFAAVLLADLGGWAWIRRRLGLPAWARTRLHIEPRRIWPYAEASGDAMADTPSADQVYFAFAERLLDSQVATNDVLDTKTAGSVGVGSTVLPLTFGLLSLSGRALPQAAESLLVLAVIAYVLLLVAAARASRIRAIEYRPDIHTLWLHSRSIDGAALRRWIAEEYAASAEINRPLLQRKARWVGYVNLALYAEGILTSVAAAIAISVL